MNERARDGGGRVQVYTGNGKGKTTAALGLCLRAAGHGRRSFVCQFMKKMFYGELDAAARLDGLITIEQHGLEEFCRPTDPPDERQYAAAREGLRRAREVLAAGEYDLVVLDEIHTAHFFGLVTLDEILEVIDARPGDAELVLTGRYAPGEVIARADLVTEMTEVRHYYNDGLPARRGIEF